MLQKLVFPDGEHPQALLHAGVNTIGAAADNDIVVRAPQMPAYAVEVQRHAPRTQLLPASDVDLRVNGTPVREMIALRAGDELRIAGVRIRLVQMPSGAAGQDSDDAEASATRAMQAAPAFVLRTVAGPGFGAVHPIAAPMIIGRAQECDIVLSLPEVSRRHAQLRPTPAGVVVEDLGSANGVFVNDRIAQQAVLQAGDEIRIGAARYLVSAIGHVSAREVRRADPPPPSRSTMTRSRRIAASVLALLAFVALVATLLAP